MCLPQYFISRDLSLHVTSRGSVGYKIPLKVFQRIHKWKQFISGLIVSQVVKI